MKRIRFAGAAASLLALTALASAAALQGFTIKRTPKEGEQLNYTLKADLDVSGAQVNIEGKMTEKTIKVDADGTYTVEASQSDLKVVLQGSEIPSPDSPPQVIAYKPGGQVAEIRGEGIDANSYRMSILNGFVEPDKPVAVGDSWSKEIPADTKLGTVAAKAEFKVVGEEKVGDYDTVKIAAVVSEVGDANPASNTSTLWLNKADWTMVKSEGKWNNVPAPHIPVAVNGTYTITRQ